MTPRILITGSRYWTRGKVIVDALREHGPGIVIHGNCLTGADAIADEVASFWGWTIERHPASWNKYGNAAGLIRNQQMIDKGADICLAFVRFNSRGTIDCIRRAEAAGIQVVRYYEE